MWWVSVICVVAGCGFEGRTASTAPIDDSALGTDAGGDAGEMDGSTVGGDATVDGRAVGTITLGSVTTGGIDVGNSFSIATTVTANTSTVLVAVATKRYRDVVNVQGLGATWTELGDQCGARDQTGVALWAGTNPTTTGDVTISLAITTAPAQSAAGVAATYSGVAALGTTVSANVIDGTCDNDRDSSIDATSFDVPITSQPASTLFAAIARRNASFTAGSGFTEIGDIARGSGGDVAGVSIMHGKAPALVGTFSSATDYAVVGVELRP